MFARWLKNLLFCRPCTANSDRILSIRFVDFVVKDQSQLQFIVLHCFCTRRRNSFCDGRRLRAGSETVTLDGQVLHLQLNSRQLSCHIRLSKINHIINLSYFIVFVPDANFAFLTRFASVELPYSIVKDQSQHQLNVLHCFCTRRPELIMKNRTLRRDSFHLCNETSFRNGLETGFPSRYLVARKLGVRRRLQSPEGLR